MGENIEQLEFEAQQRVDTLSMIYEKVELITYRLVSYIDDGWLIITDLEGNIKFKKDAEKSTIAGKFLVVEGNQFDAMNGYTQAWEVYSLETGINTLVNRPDYLSKQVVYNIGTDLVVVPYSSSQALVLNTELQPILEVDIYSRPIKTADDTMTKTTFCIYIGKIIWVCYSKEKKQVLSYDEVVIDAANGLSVVAVEYDHTGIMDNKGGIWRRQMVSYDRQSSEIFNCLSIFKYRLCKYGARHGKGYNGIAKTTEYMNTKYLSVFNFNGVERKFCENHCNLLFGLIDEDGNELISPLYKSVQYIGGDTFLLTWEDEAYGTVTSLSSLSRGTLAGPLPADKVYQHKSVNMVVINTLHIDGNIWLYKEGDGCFLASEISKHFDCWYCSSMPEVIRIDVGKVYKYIDNRLTPITNPQMLRRLSVLNDQAWVKM